ncbi:sulfatase [Fimbriiglobus ruber]|uniref:Choline-sulfatase n=1 Tax=Fimbriiglobus ruber TaxID=1908690 RepID=A0A225DYT9_9BACT|nr:sulfatase [Fimbriiglobus ruber]OWK46492.1 Choline-sulfatase [Fimbriiglobus ruber]
MRRCLVAWALVVAPFATTTRAADQPKTAAKPNVLFIAIDDLRDWVGFLGDNQVKTPNMDRLAARGLTFTRSYCAAPVCNPSRTALMSGLRPGSTGVYENNADWRTTNAAGVTHLTKHFMANGYFASGAGKIYHGSYPPPKDYWNDFANQGAEEDDTPKAKKGKPGDDSWGFGNFQFGPTTGGDDSLADYHIVSYCVKELRKKHDKPFFLACGLHKPHLPWHVPQKYFDLYPLDQIKLPPVKENDLADVPPAGFRMAKPAGDHKKIVEAGKWKEAVRAYLATISYCDAMVGRLIDEFDKSAYRDNTVVVLWSDHGWHLGEKEHWRKFALWEEATRSPAVYIVPGLTKPGTVCERTVDHMSLYPTLCDLCGLDTPKHVQGKSIKSLLGDPAAPWADPAVTTYLHNNHAVRTEKWRYIRYADGSEELYDHAADPHEWTNLATAEKYAGVKKDLAKWLPTENKPDAGKKGKQ